MAWQKIALAAAGARQPWIDKFAFAFGIALETLTFSRGREANRRYSSARHIGDGANARFNRRVGGEQAHER